MQNISWDLEPVHVVHSPVQSLVPDYATHPPSGTFQGEPDSITTEWRLIPAGYVWDSAWELNRELIVEVRVSKHETVALTCLTVPEYGIGDNVKDAVYDLLTSLSGYLEVLESRKDKLGDSAVSDLELLNRLTRRRDTN